MYISTIEFNPDLIILYTFFFIAGKKPELEFIPACDQLHIVEILLYDFLSVF